MNTILSQLLFWSNITLIKHDLTFLKLALRRLTPYWLLNNNTQIETVLNSRRNKHVMILLDRTNGQFK